MKILIVGGGGREHALAWKLCRDDPSLEILAALIHPAVFTSGHEGVGARKAASEFLRG